MNNPKLSPPSQLSTEGKSWWRRLVTEYEITDDAGFLLLQTALEAFDRMRSCQEAIARDGELIKDRWGQLKPHPLLPTERDARSQMLASLKALNLDIEPVRDRGRPPGVFGNANKAA